MNKLIVLGAGQNQLDLIRTAKSMGCYIISIDYDDKAVGINIANKFYNYSILDYESILYIARMENVDGILTNSEPAMPIATKISNVLNLPSNPYKSIEILTSKNLFRNFLLENNFNCPSFVTMSETNINSELLNGLTLPLMVKPVDSSGSRGVEKINSMEEIDKAIQNAMLNSKSGTVIIEEYIENKYNFMIGGDIFVSKGQVVYWGIMNSMRNHTFSELIPTGTSYPTLLKQNELEVIKDVVNRLLKSLTITDGAFNLEMMITKDGEVYPIELNPRHGGNDIPKILYKSTGFNVNEMMVLTALGDDVRLSSSNEKTGKFMSTYVLHAKKSGILKDIYFTNYLEQKIIDKNILVKKNDFINEFKSAEDLLGIIILEFESQKEMLNVLENIENYINIIVEDRS